MLFVRKSSVSFFVLVNLRLLPGEALVWECNVHEKIFLVGPLKDPPNFFYCGRSSVWKCVFRRKGACVYACVSVCDRYNKAADLGSALATNNIGSPWLMMQVSFRLESVQTSRVRKSE